MLKNLIYAIICSLSLISFAGCSIYRMDLRQGNELSQDKLDQLKPRMTKKQVENILGTATLDPINPNRLDYYFMNKIHKPKKYTSNHLILYFDKNGELNHYEGNFTLKYLPTTSIQNLQQSQKRN